MDASKIAIQIASEFTGSKAFKKAETATEKLQRTVKNLARTLGIAFSATAVVNFGKASVRAFADAEREGAVLANTMKNLGLAFDTSRVTAYIDRIGRLYGVTGEQAVPAMQALLSATGSVTKSQELMNTALNIAASNNISLSEAATGLSQAYLGNRKALNQYNTGLTKAELQLKSFEDLQKLLDTRLAGAATDAAATYSGQMLILAENAEQAKEVIGKGLVDSFVLLAGANGLPSATTAMQDFAKATAEATLGAASLIEKLKTGLSPNGFNLTGLIPVIGGYIGPGGVLDKLREEGRKLSSAKMGAPGAISGKSLVGAAYFAAQKKADDAATKRAKELQAIERKRLDTLKKIAVEKAKKLALDKLSAFLNKAEQLFDIDRIQLAAAAMAKQTEEDKVRIRLKQEILDLEQAINDGNVDAATKLASAINQDAKLLGQLRGDMINLGNVPNPFTEWLNTLNQMLATLLAMTTIIPTITALVGMGGFNAGSARMGESAGNAAAGLPANSLTDFMGFGDEHLGALARQSGNATTINYNINASGIGDQQIASVVQNAIQDLNRYGSSTTYAGAI